ncbi:biotin/lipoate A/B protein ligase family protein [Citricoccus sp. K5]|uniref:lipoate--protein ligase family protein n=1 Tax=Citricoccus sp. K5 TaxID=2653135 RepID=UPI0012F46F4A|nr:biotin/lipoate A/B protein ligase family protein [Citricoccus sp. K5]VXB35943.1 Lipoate-protein ligase A [Citricoccus sp. K5]
MNTPLGSSHHGEYKVTGGKLVIADLTVSDGAVATASINGDFFLEPDEALQDINRSLRGLDLNAPHGTIAETVRAAVGPETVMFGFDPAAVATAVRRALGHATTWEDHEWEILAPQPLPITTQVALDQILTEDVAAGRRRPALRLWQWTEPAVVIGSFQSLANEVDPEGVARHGITVARRISGGGAMFMEADNCVTYSLYLPQSLVDGMSFADSYPFLDAWAMDALARTGVEAFYQPLNDIATPEGKIGGAAQKRLASGGLLHHVTMSYDIDADKMTDVLRIGREKIRDKGIRSAKKRVDPLRRQTGLTRPEIWETMMSTFTDRYGATRTHLTEDEISRAETLATAKFTTPAWTARVP